MSKYQVKVSSNYKTQRKKLSQNELILVDEIVTKLANDEILEPKYNDHQLKGNLKDYRECHIKPNLLLIYQKRDYELILYCFAVGSHSELYNK